MKTSAPELHQLLSYDETTGEFRWRVSRNGIHVGMRAGNLHPGGYVSISINGTPYQAHRLAWLYITGSWPVNQLDHMDRNKANNRFANLREATNSQNQMNSRIRQDNTSGIKGVYWEAWSSRWIAFIHIAGRKTKLGRFLSIEKAKEARLLAERVHYLEFSEVIKDYMCPSDVGI